MALYGSVVNEDRLADFLTHAQSFIEARFLVMGMFDPHDPERHAHQFFAPHAIGQARAMEFLALAAQSHVDGSVKMLDSEPQQVLLDLDFYPERAELSERPTMKHLSERYGASHIGVVNAQANGAWVDYLMFAHADAQFGDPEKVRRRVSRLVPHIAVASEVRRAFRLLEHRYRAIFAALNFLRYGVGIILDNGELMLANDTLQAVLQARDGLSLSPNRQVRAVESDADTDLQAAVGSTLMATKQPGTLRRTIVIPRRSGADPYILDLAPFNDGLQGELNVEVRGALIFLVDPEQASSLSHQGLSAAFGLTPTEGEICRHVLDGYSNRDIADARRVTLPTVKTQVSAIFEKTRVTDRAGLVRLASKVSPPLVDDD